ncbi:MAG: metallophosphoesterase [Pirellulaceae bacterium]|nr:metallophosphoesterase [Planctomycetales bacterium]MCA9164212.1 metallophosphoesterase [Planctomycetales bacterium]MCA9227962.1 metallophosphoesterase [Planctomycetales bacterium]
MSRSSFFVSDLHMFSRRSRADRHLQSIHESARQAKQFVFGGDIFDFRWTTLPSIPATIDASVRWLDDVVSEHPECEFHFVLGNHDSHRDFVRQLDAFAVNQPNLTWHPYHVRLGQGFFLHGDVTDGPTDLASLARRRDRWHEDRHKGPMANRLYDLAIKTRMHKVVSAGLHRHRAVLSRVHRYLQNVGHDAEAGVKHVYFGHTHASMANVSFGGLTFHNGGAPIDGLSFRIVPVHEEQAEALETPAVQLMASQVEKSS